MTSRDEDKKHIADTMARDSDLSTELQSLSVEALKSLSFYLSDFANGQSENGTLESYVLGSVPTKNEQSIIKKLISEVNDDDAVANYDEADNLANTAGSSYRNNNGAYLLSVITLVLAKLLVQSNNLQKYYAKDEQDSEINYLVGENGDLNNVATKKELNNLTTNTMQIADGDNGSAVSNNYYSTVDTINKIYAKVNNCIKQDPSTSDFMAIVGSYAFAKAVVSKKDAASVTTVTKIPYTISGDIQRLTALYMRNYRTSSAMWDSNLKLEVSKKYAIKQATIINELGACKHCMDRIGRIYNVETACSYVPQHYCCRCEVKLLISYDEDDYIDSDV